MFAAFSRGHPFLSILLGKIQHVSDAANRLDHLRRKPIVDLAAQVADIDIDDVRQAVVVHVPHMLDDHRPAERASAVPHQVFEDAELLWR